MEVIPSIDLLRGMVVRLVRGRVEEPRIYSHNPVEVAKNWESEGARRIHVVDLDAALGKGSNLERVRRIIEAVRVPVQVGGGVRSVDKALLLMEMGADRVVVGTMAFERRDEFRRLLKTAGSDRVILALDYYGGEVVVRGWRARAGVGVLNAIREFRDEGVREFLLTSTAKDGTLSSPDLEMLKEACRVEGVRVIASGGVASLEDVVRVKEAGASALIVGRAIYEGLFTLKEAVRVAEG